MAEDPKPRVEVDGDDIVITMPGTSFGVCFRKSPDAAELIASDYVRDDRDASISRNEFLALARQAANDKARELGWIV